MSGCCTELCSKNSKDDDVQLVTEPGNAGRFFLHSRRKGGVNTVKKVRVLSGAFVAVLVVVMAQGAMAQSTIFNIPTTDTVSKGKGYFEFDFLSQAPAADPVRTYVYNPRVLVGVSDKVEVGVNFPTTKNSGVPASTPSTFAYIQPNLKIKYYANDDAGLALAAGILWNTPLNQRDGQDSWGLVYTNFSKKVKSGDYGPRLHVGPYGIISGNQNTAEGPVSFTGPRAGILAGYEQPVHSKVSIVADWFSGKNYYGYFTPGVSITLPKSGLLNIGYSLGNNSWEDSNAAKNRYFFAYYGVTF
jgi:hypothetical protein